MKKSISMKAVVLLLVAVLLIGSAIGGTLAWLIDSTETVTNTFTVGDINIDLTENTGADYKIIPGTSQDKDPIVTVKANSENSWVFVQVKEVNNTVTSNADAAQYVTWAIANGWTQLGDTENGVSTFYRTQNYVTSDTDATYEVLSNNKVSYDSDLTKADLEAVDESNKPQLIFKAFAIQVNAGENAAEAWGQIASSTKLS